MVMEWLRQQGPERATHRRWHWTGPQSARRRGTVGGHALRARPELSFEEKERAWAYPDQACHFDVWSVAAARRVTVRRPWRPA